MRRGATRFLSALNIIALPAAASAQVSPAVQAAYDKLAAQAAVEQTDRGARLVSSGAPNDRATAGFSESNVQIVTEDGEQLLSAAFSLDIQSYTPKPDKEGFFRIDRTKLAIVATVPVEEKQMSARLFSGDNLVDGTKVKISITHFQNVLGSGVGAKALLDSAYQACIPAAANGWVQASAAVADAKTSIGEFQAAIDNTTATITDYAAGRGKVDGSYEIALNNMTKSAAPNPVAAYVMQQCVPGQGILSGDQALLYKYGDLEAFRSKFFDNKSNMIFYGADASLGQKSYEYLARAAFRLDSVSKTKWSIGAYAGIFNSSLTFSARARFVYGVDLKLPGEATICHAVPGEAEEHCVTGADGLPVRDKTGLISVETRHVLPLSNSNKIALAPQFTYRFEDSEFGAELPIYLAPDKDGKLSGGVKFDYDSKGDNFGIGVFVGVPFSIFYQ